MFDDFDMDFGMLDMTKPMEETPVRATRAEISLDNLVYNYENIKKRAGDKLICAVVKADAYGHGIECIELLQDEGVDYMAVAFLEEAIALRQRGIDRVPIMLLGHTFPDRVEEVLDWDIEPAVYQYDFAKALSDAAVERGVIAPIQIKLETGMGRIGIDYRTAVDEIKKIAELPGIKINGLFTHFATADSKDKSFTHTQLARFAKVVKDLEDEGIEIPIKHVENSAALMDFETNVFDMVRPGIVLYGHYPSEEVKVENLDIKPVMSFKSKVVQVKELEPGESVGYGRTYIAEEPRVVATFPAGYADGYSRMLSHKGTEVFINGHRAPIIGNICMDQAVADVTDIPGVKVGDDVELFGENVTAEEVADWMGTIPYEVTCMVNKRVPRVYEFMGDTTVSNEILNDGMYGMV